MSGDTEITTTIGRKFRTFLREPWGSMQRRGQYELYVRRARAFWHRRPLLHDFQKRRPDHAIAPDYADLWFLYQAVRRRRPRTVLEFGSGCSTLAMALALKENAAGGAPSGRLLSIESMESWSELNRRALPNELREFCQIQHCPVEETSWEATPCFRHRGLPVVQPELLYLDGPVLSPARRVAVDPLEMEPSFPPGFYLVVDGRWENAMFLKEHFQRSYRFEYRTLFQNSTFELLGSGAAR